MSGPWLDLTGAERGGLLWLDSSAIDLQAMGAQTLAFVRIARAAMAHVALFGPVALADLERDASDLEQDSHDALLIATYRNLIAALAVVKEPGA